MSRRIFSWLYLGLTLTVVALAAPKDARAQARGANDKEVETIIEEVITNDYVKEKFDDALEKLKLAEQACGTPRGCSPKMRARMYIAFGHVYAGGQKKVSEAKEAFAKALKEDGTASLFSDFITPEVEKAFSEARSAGSASGGTEETKNASAADRKVKKTWSGEGRAPRGWKSAEAYFYYTEGRKSEASQAWLDCVNYAQASLMAESRPATRYLSASCEEKSGLWVEAYGDFQVVAETADRAGMQAFARQARQHIQGLKDRIPKIIIRKPANTDDFVVKMNDSEVSSEQIGGEIWINPGQRIVKATGKINGAELEFEQIVDAEEFATATVDVRLGPKGTKADPTIMRCVLGAFSREALTNCLGVGGASGSALNIRALMEVTGYHDTDHVDIFSPAWLVAIDSPTGGWGMSASFVVDVVTTASTDIVATASPRVREARYAPGLSGTKKFGGLGAVTVHGEVSSEPDYLATGGGIGYSVDVAGKRLTPSIGYNLGFDTVGRSGTPFAIYNRQLLNHGVSFALSTVVNKSTIFVPAITFVAEVGDQSKPYRYMPMFKESDVPKLYPGISIAEVNKYRLPERPLEQLPPIKLRYAVAGLFAHRFQTSTIRVEERLYTDSWGLKASTTDITYLYDVNESVRLWPHARVHAQTGANFYHLGYAAESNGTSIKLPTYRTGDREEGPLVTGSLGLSGRMALGEKKNFAIAVMAEGVYTQFLDQLYITSRLGVLGVSTLEVAFE